MQLLLCLCVIIYVVFMYVRLCTLCSVRRASSYGHSLNTERLTMSLPVLLTIASCNILSQDPYLRHAKHPIPVEIRRHHFMKTMHQLMPSVDIFCFQEWDYGSFNYCTQELYDFFTENGYSAITEKSQTFGRIIFYRQERLSPLLSTYKQQLFNQSLVYGYLSITFSITGNDQQADKKISVTTLHLPYHRKKGVSAENFLQKIHANEEKRAVVCGDFNASSLDFSITPFHAYTFAQLPDDKTHRILIDNRAGVPDHEIYAESDHLGVLGAQIKKTVILPRLSEQLLSHHLESCHSDYFSDHATLITTIELQ